jgi:hypothetical protein
MKIYQKLAALTGLATLLSIGVVAVSGPAYAATGCQVFYQRTSTTPFAGAIGIVNTGDPITNGWTLTFAFPTGQRITNGWPVTFTQPPGSNQVTVTSNAPWNSSLATGTLFSVGFVGTAFPVNIDPTVFTLNGTLCNVPVNSAAPVVFLSSPMAGQVFPVGAAVPLFASANDPEAGGGIARVEFHVDGVLRWVDTTFPYSGTVPGLPAGTHTVTATAFDNGNPVRSAQKSVAFSVA